MAESATSAGEAVPDRRRARHDRTKAEILAAAWDIARRDGIGAVSLRDVALAVDMKPPSLYTYFESKQALYDAMFAQGWEALRQRTETRATVRAKAEALKTEAHEFFAFCTEDPARYQLMFQRPMPGFEPSAEAYAVSVVVFDGLRKRFAAHGIEDADGLELWTILMTGVTARQVANDPGGTRYEHHLDPLVDMYLAHVRPRRRTGRKQQP
jgi:AcrR family transcriptional regulator